VRRRAWASHGSSKVWNLVLDPTDSAHSSRDCSLPSADCSQDPPVRALGAVPDGTRGAFTSDRAIVSIQKLTRTRGPGAAGAGVLAPAGKSHISHFGMNWDIPGAVSGTEGIPWARLDTLAVVDQPFADREVRR